MFTKMGVSLGILILSFFTYLIYDIMAHSNDDVFNFCWENATYTTHKNYITIPSSYISTVQQILLAISETLLYISAIEFICSQSPQKMKGILYGLFYTLKSFYQDLSTPIIYFFAHHWNSEWMSSCSGYYIFNIALGLITLIAYIFLVKRYKYRKRDDICKSSREGRIFSQKVKAPRFNGFL